MQPYICYQHSRVINQLKSDERNGYQKSGSIRLDRQTERERHEHIEVAEAD